MAFKIELNQSDMTVRLCTAEGDITLQELGIYIPSRSENKSSQLSITFHSTSFVIKVNYSRPDVHDPFAVSSWEVVSINEEEAAQLEAKERARRVKKQYLITRKISHLDEFLAHVTSEVENCRAALLEGDYKAYFSNRGGVYSEFTRTGRNSLQIETANKEFTPETMIAGFIDAYFKFKN